MAETSRSYIDPLLLELGCGYPLKHGPGELDRVVDYGDHSGRVVDWRSVEADRGGARPGILTLWPRRGNPGRR